jgi:hypothetical protein
VRKGHLTISRLEHEALMDAVLDAVLHHGPVLGGGNPWRPASIRLWMLVEPADGEWLTQIEGKVNDRYVAITGAIHGLWDLGLITCHRDVRSNQFYRIEIA